MSLDNELRASIAAQMLMPREERPDPQALKRLERHLLELRERIAAENEEAEEAQRGMDAWRHQLDQEEPRV